MFMIRKIEGRVTKLKTVAEIITKKIYHQGGEARARDIFVAAGWLCQRAEIIAVLRRHPIHVKNALERLQKLDPELVAATIDELMIAPAYR